MFALTPTQLAELRNSVQSRSPDGTPALAAPFIVWSPAGVWCLHAGGRCLAESTDPILLCHALANEREHAGWLASVLCPDHDLTAPPVCYDSDGNAHEGLRTSYHAGWHGVASPRPAPPNVADVSLDDLF